MALSTRRANRRVLIAVAVFLAASASGSAFSGLSAQQPPPSPPSDAKPESKSKKNAIILRGCVEGSTLSRVEARDAAVAPDTVRLTGNRSMRGTLKEYNGHWVELTGTLKGYRNAANGALVKDTGKTKIYVGGTERRSPQDQLERASPPTFDVDLAKDLAPQCTAG